MTKLHLLFLSKTPTDRLNTIFASEDFIFPHLVSLSLISWAWGHIHMNCVVHRHFWVEELHYRWTPDLKANTDVFNSHPRIQSLRCFIGNFFPSLVVASYNNVETLDISYPFFSPNQWSALGLGLHDSRSLRTLILRGFHNVSQNDTDSMAQLRQLKKIILHPSDDIGFFPFFFKVNKFPRNNAILTNLIRTCYDS